MDQVSFDTFDPNEYTRTPNVPTRSTIGLGRALLKLRPTESNVVIDKAAIRLEATLEELENLLMERLRLSNSESPVREIDLDRATDGLWVSLRDRLTGWFAFDHPGLAALSGELHEKGELPLAKQDAARARALHDRLFGTNGIAFVQQPFFEQAAVMASLLRLIDADGHDSELAELVGARWLPALRACQIQYEAMIDDRLARERGKVENLAKPRNRLRRMISAYNTSVITLLDEHVPESLDVVMEALRPMVRMRQILSRRGAQAVDDDIEQDLLGDGANELLEGDVAPAP